MKQERNNGGMRDGKRKKRQIELMVKTQGVINFLSVYGCGQGKHKGDALGLIQFRIYRKQLCKETKTLRGVAAKAEEEKVGRVERRKSSYRQNGELNNLLNPLK